MPRTCGARDLARQVLIPDPAAYLNWDIGEHLVATQGEDLEPRYFRDIDGREVDFVVTEGRAPVLMVECQWGDAPPAPGLRYLKARFPRCEAWQVSAVGAKDYETPEGLRAAPALALLRRLA